MPLANPSPSSLLSSNFSNLLSSTITAFNQIIKSPTLSSRLVALSPLFVLCLPRLSLRICIAQVGPLRLSRPFSPNILCVFFFFPSLSRISRPSSRASTTLSDLVASFEGTLQFLRSPPHHPFISSIKSYKPLVRPSTKTCGASLPTNSLHSLFHGLCSPLYD